MKAGFDVSIIVLDQTNVVIARNTLAKMAVDVIKDKEKDIKLVWWLDSDHWVSYQDFLNLLYHYDLYKESDGLDCLSARYITRDWNTPKVCAFINTAQLPKRSYVPVRNDQKGVVEVDSFGFGWVFMSPDVILKMYDKYGQHQFMFMPYGEPEDGKTISEDIDWCEKAKALGFRLAVDNDVEIGHLGGKIDSKVLRL
jgi:hypothetical protein